MFMLLAMLLTGTDGSAASDLSPPPTRVKGSLVGLFTSEDYPTDALRKGDQGTVSVDLRIAPDGHVSDCSVVGSSGSPSLDAATCHVLTERARFEPATDHGGRPTSDHYRQRITWRIPRPDGTLRLPPQDSILDLTLAVRDSELVKCTGQKTIGALTHGPIILDCSAFRSMLPKLTQLGPANIGASFSILLHTEILVGDGYVRRAHVENGTRTIQRLSVDALGKVTECATLDENGVPFANEDEQACAKSAPTFSPLPPNTINRTDRHVVFVSTTQFTR